MNKRGAEKIISIYWFAILFIVVGAVVYMAYIFYGAPYDVRGIESGILTENIANCLAEGGYFRINVLNSEDFKNNFLMRCNLNFEVEDNYGWGEQEQYYVEIDFYEFDSSSLKIGNKLNFEIVEGNINIKTAELLENPEIEGRSFYVLDKITNQQYIVNIHALVRKTEKNEI